MATDLAIFDVAGLTAASDLSTKQHYAVKISDQREVDLAGVGNGFAILQNKATTVLPPVVRIVGISKAIAGDTITAGDPLTSDTDGKLVKMVPDLTPSVMKNLLGWALEDAVVNDIFSMLVQPAVPVAC